MSSPAGACCVVWSPQMWFIGRLQRTCGHEAGGNNPQTVKTYLSVLSHTRPEQHRDCLGPANGDKGIFFSSTLAYNTSSCVVAFSYKRAEHTSSWPLIKHLPWTQPRKGICFYLSFYGLACHSVILRRLASFFKVDRIVLDQQGGSFFKINQIVLTKLSIFGFS